MANGSFEEMERELANYAARYENVCSHLTEAITERDRQRAEQAAAAERAARMRKRLLYIGILAVCCLAAYLFYQQQFGMF